MVDDKENSEDVLDIFFTLREQLRGVNSRKDAIKHVYNYWNNPLTKRAREQVTTNEEAANSFFSWAENLSNPDGYQNFEFIWPTLINAAEKDPKALKALTRVVLAWLKHEKIPRPVRDAAAKILSGDFNPSGRTAPKTTPGNLAKTRQLSMAVWALKNEANYSLSTSSSSAENAFDVVAEAAEVGFDVVKEAWKKHKIKKT